MSNFCTNCGAKLNQGQSFCTGCGTKTNGQEQPQNIAPKAVVTHHNNTAKYNSGKRSASPKKILTSIVIFFVSLILIFIGIRSMSLAVRGADINASIVSARQATNTYDDGPDDPRRFEVKYEFYISGVSYKGSTTQIFPYGITQNTTIPVKYMPNAPQRNAAAADAKILTGILLIGLGGIFIFTSIIIPIKKSSM